MRRLVALDAKRPVCRQTAGNHHDIERCPERFKGNAAADFHVAGKVDTVALEHALELPGDGLGARMIRRHAIAHQAIRHRQAVEDDDLCFGPMLAKRLGHVASRRP
ncbi:hypothetical protein D3C80_1572930 [compost metagenome]